jgi:hypothetical protein
MSIIKGIEVLIVSILTLIGVLRTPAVSLPETQATPNPTPTPVVRTISSPSSSSPTTAISSPQSLSVNWSGYAATGGTFTGVSGTWTVPVVASGGNNGTDATWVGIGGVGTRDLIQAGTMGTVNGSGGIDYSVFFETLPESPQSVDLAINGGDSITVILTQQSATLWQIVIRDNTTGQNVTFTDRYNSSLSSAEWIQEAPSGFRRVLPLDNFGTIQFTDGWTILNGSTVSISGASATPITMANSSGQALATPSTLGSDGAGFSITRTSSSNTQSTIFRSTRRRAF